MLIKVSLGLPFLFGRGNFDNIDKSRIIKKIKHLPTGH